MVFLHFEEQLKILFLKIPAPQNFGGGDQNPGLCPVARSNANWVAVKVCGFSYISLHEIQKLVKNK